MKILMTAVALVIAAPAAAQSAPAQHDQHQPQGHDQHGQHQPGQHEQHGGMDCCADRDGNGRMDCCDEAENGQRADCCAEHEQHQQGAHSGH